MYVTAGLYAFFTLGHSYGFNFRPGLGAAEELVFAAMRAYTFDIQGVTTSHWRSYRGFGHLLTVLLVLMTVLSVLVARQVRQQPALARPLIAALLLTSIAITALSWGFFFTAPATTATLATISLVIALARAK
jgi:hypothetical protein